MRLIVESRAVRLVIATIAAAVATPSVPVGNLWLKCLQPASEACEWSRAYLPLSLGLMVVILGIPVFVVTLFLLRRYAGTQRR